MCLAETTTPAPTNEDLNRLLFCPHFFLRVRAVLCVLLCMCVLCLCACVLCLVRVHAVSCLRGLHGCMRGCVPVYFR
jgi:hypothetical protein